MAAIDKIYVDNYDQYLQFKQWCEEQPLLVDKYGKKVSITTYLYDWDKPFENSASVFNAPYYVDAYVIRNCPFDFIQEQLMLNYGHWSQERIKQYYEDVKNGFQGWAKLEDFITLPDGTMTIQGLDETDPYTDIKNNKLYTSPKRKDYEYGKHFRCTKHPQILYNTPIKGNWYVTVETPKEYDFIWYHKDTNTWDFYDEFVVFDWSSSAAYIKTIKALKRLILKWKFPIGTKVLATGRYTNEEYEFVVTK